MVEVVIFSSLLPEYIIWEYFPIVFECNPINNTKLQNIFDRSFVILVIQNVCMVIGKYIVIFCNVINKNDITNNIVNIID